MKAAFLDRDGVINEEVNYLSDTRHFRFIEGVEEAIRRLINCGYEIVIITNQAGIAKGHLTAHDYYEVTEFLVSGLERSGLKVLGIYHCPHHPTATLPLFRKRCSCRKPAPGLFLRAISQFQIDPAISVMVGDKRSDLEAAHSAGITRNFLVRSGHKISDVDATKYVVMANLLEVANHLYDLEGQ